MSAAGLAWGQVHRTQKQAGSWPVRSSRSRGHINNMCSGQINSVLFEKGPQDHSSHANGGAKPNWPGQLSSVLHTSLSCWCSWRGAGKRTPRFPRCSPASGTEAPRALVGLPHSEPQHLSYQGPWKLPLYSTARLSVGSHGLRPLTLSDLGKGTGLHEACWAHISRAGRRPWVGTRQQDGFEPRLCHL